MCHEEKTGSCFISTLHHDTLVVANMITCIMMMMIMTIMMMMMQEEFYGKPIIDADRELVEMVRKSIRYMYAFQRT